MLQEPGAEGLSGKTRQTSMTRYPESDLQKPASGRETPQQIGRSSQGSQGLSSGADVGKEAAPERDAALGLIHVQELSLDAGHINARRALGFAALALKTQIQHRVHLPAGQRVWRQ